MSASETSHLTRREFLRRGVLGVTGLSVLSACRDASGPTGPSDGPADVDVLVVGAGLAGLVAAYELDRVGLDVVVLEARAEAGGRVRTVRTPFADGQLTEEGAARIPQSHELTLAYAQHFGLPLDPFYPTEGLFLLRFQGKVSLSPSNTITPSEQPWYKIRGGMDRLPKAFAAELGERVRFGVPVVRVENGDTVASVHYEDGGVERTITARRVICTVPFPVMDRIQFDPPLSANKRDAIRTLRYTPSTRVYLQFSERFWEAEGWNGFGSTDFPEEIWHPSWEQPGPRGILTTYLRGPRATEFAALPHEERVASLLTHWESLVPGGVAQPENTASQSWLLDPWAGSGYATFSGLERQALAPIIAAPEGRIRFAGEHDSTNNGWILGALESGLRAAAWARTAVGATARAG